MHAQSVSMVLVFAVDSLLVLLLYGIISFWRRIHLGITFSNIRDFSKDFEEKDIEKFESFRDNLFKQLDLNRHRSSNLLTNTVILMLVNVGIVKSYGLFVTFDGVPNSFFSCLIAFLSAILVDFIFYLYGKSELNAFMISLCKDRQESEYLSGDPILSSLVMSLISTELTTFFIRNGYVDNDKDSVDKHD